MAAPRSLQLDFDLMKATNEHRKTPQILHHAVCFMVCIIIHEPTKFKTQTTTGDSVLFKKLTVIQLLKKLPIV
jgi:hypothetical protein